MKSYQEGAVGSTIVGNNVILDATNDINIKASNVIAIKDGIENTGGNIIATAGNNINILAETLDNSYYSKVKSSGFSTSFETGGGGLTAGVSYNKNSLEQTSNGTTVAVSTLMSEGSTLLDAGNKIRTEAMQANIGEDLIIRGKNGVELLDAKETYEEKVKQKSSSIGVSVSAAFTPAQLVDTIGDVSNNIKDYGFGNTSQTINTLGNGFQDLRNVASLTGNLRNWYEADGYIGLKGLVTDGLHNPVSGGNNLKDAAKGMVNASVTASYSQSSYESNTSGTKSIAGVINVGGNMVIQSEGDVKLVNQKITVGENIIIDAKNFEALAGENTYKNDTKSNSMGMNVGYDIVNQNALGGLNASTGNSNTTSKSYDNTFISAGGTFQLTTKEDATFKGANVIADKINFDIGKNLNIISLQDEYKSHGENSSVGLNVSGKLPGTQAQQGYAIPTIGGGHSENNEESKWVSNQTSIIANNGGSIKVNETLTNIGSIIGSLSNENKLGIDAKKVVIENLEDYNKGENYGVQVSGIGVKTPIGQTGIQYGSHDKEQNTNATFVNTEVTENGVKLDLDKLGINTDITKSQVVTKDEVVEQIDTVLHTDLANKAVRDEVIKDVKGLINTPGDIIAAAQNSKGNQNFFDELKGTIGKSDIIAELENNKVLKDIAKELKGKDKVTTQEVEGYLTAIAQIAANELGSDKKVIVKAILEGDIGAGAHLAEDGKTIVIYANLNDYASLDMYSALDSLMKEVYHDNAINPYTYNKTEAQMRADKDKSLQNREEGSTQTIGDYKSKGKGEKIDWNDKLVDNGKLVINSEEYAKNKELGLLEFDDPEKRSQEKAKELYNANCKKNPGSEDCKKLKKEIDKTIYDQKKPMAEKAIKRKKVEVFQKKPDYSKSPG
ncbi:MAG: hemagglutinin repeat-containing protein, partial [Sebaldella sp.]|nr:hemagglutinin repeat-containing protein [Sebaldella sp.]